MATYYVGTPTTGNGNGSLANPWNQAGFDAAALLFGDTVTVSSGTLTTTVNQLFATLPTNTVSTKGAFLGYEGAPILAAPGTIVAYGADFRWSYRVVGASGQITLNNETFNDPAYGTPKSGYLVSALSIPTSSFSGSYNISDSAPALAASGGPLFNAATNLTATTAAT
ncbi:MAG: hypothetical protein ACKOPN_07475, partial [Prochlorococcaceae cyanobacterium]